MLFYIIFSNRKLTKMEFNVWDVPRTGITVLNDREVIISSHSSDKTKGNPGHAVILDTVSLFITKLTNLFYSQDKWQNR